MESNGEGTIEACPIAGEPGGEGDVEEECDENGRAECDDGLTPLGYPKRKV
jgi:hypothetical protein